MMCVPPSETGSKSSKKDLAELDSLRKVRCPRLMSSAAEYYRNRNWKKTVNIYKEITTLSCDEWNPIYAPPKKYINIMPLHMSKWGNLIVQNMFFLMVCKNFPKKY